MKPNSPKTPKNRRFSHIALALALSCGTVGGMLSFATLSSAPAMAQAANGGGGGGGGSGGPGSESGSVMAITHVSNNNPNRTPRTPPTRTRFQNIVKCNGETDGRFVAECQYEAPTTPRIVSIHGFANCAIVQQTPNGQFYCLRPM